MTQGQPTGWARVDAEFLAALGPTTPNRLLSVDRLLSGFEYYTHSVPRPDEVAEAARRLAGSGLVGVSGDSVCLTERGAALWTDPHPAGFELVDWLSEQLEQVRLAHAPTAVLDPEVWQRVLDWYAAPLRRRILWTVLGMRPTAMGRR